MIRINDIHAIRLIAQAAEIEFVPKLHHCIATYSETDQLAGGVIFTNYRIGSVQSIWLVFSELGERSDPLSCV